MHPVALRLQTIQRGNLHSCNMRIGSWAIGSKLQYIHGPAGSGCILQIPTVSTSGAPPLPITLVTPKSARPSTVSHQSTQFPTSPYLPQLFQLQFNPSPMGGESHCFAQVCLLPKVSLQQSSQSSYKANQLIFQVSWCPGNGLRPPVAIFFSLQQLHWHHSYLPRMVARRIRLVRLAGSSQLLKASELHGAMAQSWEAVKIVFELNSQASRPGCTSFGFLSCIIRSKDKSPFKYTPTVTAPSSASPKSVPTTWTIEL